jgi:hypothetical protein
MMKGPLPIAVVVCLLLAGCMSGVGDTTATTSLETTTAETAAEPTATAGGTDTGPVSESVAVTTARQFATDYTYPSAARRAGNDSTAVASGPDTAMEFRYVETRSDIPGVTGTATASPSLESITAAAVLDTDQQTRVVRLYTWSRVNGVVTNWTVRVNASGEVTQAIGVSVATGVGDSRTVAEGMVSPEPGVRYIDVER